MLNDIKWNLKIIEILILNLIYLDFLNDLKIFFNIITINNFIETKFGNFRNIGITLKEIVVVIVGWLLFQNKFCAEGMWRWKS